MDNNGVRVSHSRRRLLAILGSAAVITGLGAHRADARQTLDALLSRPIEQPTLADEKAFLFRAFEMREIATRHGDQAYGAVVVKNNQVVGQSWSRVTMDGDPTGHAEMSALRDAARRNGPNVLNGATLYSTSHACSMCEAAAAWVGISQMVHGRDAIHAGAPRSC
jgi:tRNA(Arg) A34 adenosine deaminase TadA